MDRATVSKTVRWESDSPPSCAEMVELVDTHVRGACVKSVRVQIPLSAPS